MASLARPTPTPYQVLARKFRPQTFGALIGQEHVKTTLENAITQNRIAHGYIFSGQRGTGKTTVARILARCLNCIAGPTTQPCGECASCLEIAAGHAPDVIEIDAASNRGINEMRELRENVRYRPARDRFKVFIIDEAHQITSEAFNALLKTLEEPPEWVVFVLCTTEAHKIPATIASRCQHFSFRSVEFQELINHLAWICRQEGIEAGDDVLAVLAQAGEGSVRDSLSALDQAIACCGTRLDAAEVRRMLGVFSTAALAEVAEALAASDAARMLAIVDHLERQGQSLQHFSRELSRYIRNLLVAKIAGAQSRFLAAPDSEREALARMAAQFSEEDLTRYLQISLDLFRDLQYSLQPRLHLELGLLRMVYAARLTGIEEALAAVGGNSAAAPSAPDRGNTAPASSGGAPPRRSSSVPSSPSATAGAAAAAPAPDPSAHTAAPQPPAASTGSWQERLSQALTAMNRPYAADAVLQSEVVENGSLLECRTPKVFRLALREQDLSAALAELGTTGRRVAITFIDEPLPGATAARQDNAQTEDELTRRALSHPQVQRFQRLFGGEVRQVRNLRG